MGLKIRLLIAFLTTIILPIVTVLILFTYFSYQLENLNEAQNNEVNELLSEINETIITNYNEIHNTRSFYNAIEPIINEYTIQVIITSLDDEVLFNSQEQQPSEQESFMFTMRESQVQTLTGEIFNVEIKSDSIDLAASQSYNKIMFTILFSVGSGFLVLVGLIIGWILYISRTILNPLKQIYTATEEMNEGNLNYEIHYNKKDEIGRFITGFNLMRDHLKQSFAKQQQYEKNRKELIATISHDLRTPLQSIKGYVEGINDGIVQDEEMKKRYLQVILSKTDQLNRLIDDLFEFSKIDLDQLVMDKRLVNSEESFSKAFQNKEIDIKHQQAKLVIDKPIPSVIINIDEKRIEQVITNLIDNAVRYGGNNITVKINNSKGKLVINIKDNGRGISNDDLPYIFNRFYRGEKSRSRDHGGTGLGLAISKSIIEAHGGEIYLESRVGEGSIFTFTLPII